MSVVTGKIEKIQDASFGNHNTNKVTIKTIQGGYVYIEFRGVLKKESDKYRVGENVVVEHSYEGKVSKSTGLSFNNLPATSIKRI